MKRYMLLIVLMVFAASLTVAVQVNAETEASDTFHYNSKVYSLYPTAYTSKPPIPSPYRSENGTETITAVLHDSTYSLIPVTIENGTPLVYSHRIDNMYGKDNQLAVDDADFPALGETGLHDEAHLDSKEMITGYPVSVITYIGRPGRFSRLGFLAEDEDVVSVLKGDNGIVRALGMTHPEMACPLFHMWNLILEVDWAYHGESIDHVEYNGRIIRLAAEAGKGWQVSIFQDEIKGMYSIIVRTELSESELMFIHTQYAYLSESEKEYLIYKLSHIRFSEMSPYYIMRYGFYEGHTEWRSDPIAVSFIFGMKSLAEIDNACNGDLYGILTNHFTNRD